MGCVPPRIPPVPTFSRITGQNFTDQEMHVRRVSTYAHYLKRMHINDLVSLRDGAKEPFISTWGLSKAERVSLQQSEWDKRTLVRPASGIAGNKANELVRAV